MKEIKRIFQWENHLQHVLDHFSKTSLSAIFEEHAGTPLVLDYSVYNCMMKCIIHQQLNLSFAYTLTERFVHAFGEQKDGVWCYPKPETIAELDYQDLRDLQFSMRKAEYTIDTSRMIAEGTLSLSELPHMADEDIMKKLIKIRVSARGPCKTSSCSDLAVPIYSRLPISASRMPSNATFSWTISRQRMSCWR